MRSTAFVLQGNIGGEKGKSIPESTVRNILRESEKMALAVRLDKKQMLHLQLLAEELICMMPQLMRYGSGKFWIECYYQKFELHVNVDTGSEFRLPEPEKPQEKRGIIRKILGAFDNALNSSKESGTQTSWSLHSYIDAVRGSKREENTDAWDELEGSIIANIADDVTITASGSQAEIVVLLGFD